MAALIMTSACKTLETPKIVDSACLSFGRLTYAIPPVREDGSRTLVVDGGNRFDTLETIKEIGGHNARYDAVCPKE